MLETLKKKSFKKVIGLVIVLYIASVVCMVVTGGGIFKLPFKKDIYDLDVSELKGQYVTADIFFIWDYYAYTTETSKSNPRPTTTSKEYIIPIGEKEYMGLYLPSKSLSKADKLMKSSQKYIDDPTQIPLEEMFAVTGTILPMGKESLEFYHEAIGYDEMSPEDQAIFLPYYLREDYLGRAPAAATYLLTVAAVICFISATVMLVRASTGAYQKDVVAFCAATGNKDQALERMSTYYESAQPVGGIIIADDWIMFQEGAHTRVWNLGNFVWAYKKTTEHRRNGIKTGTTYSVVLCNTSKRRFEVSMSEDEVGEALQYIADNSPGTVLGYNKKLDRMYQKEFDKFQRILTDPQVAAEVFEQ